MGGLPARRRAGGHLRRRGQYTPLYMAVYEDFADMVGVLLAHGADPSGPADNGATPLHVAARFNRVACAKRLLAAGAAPDAVDADGQTPLHIAARRNRPAMAALLLGAGRADVDGLGVTGCTALYLAAKHGHADVVAVLHAHGAALDRGRPLPHDVAPLATAVTKVPPSLFFPFYLLLL